jgi:hypothetical protein
MSTVQLNTRVFEPESMRIFFDRREKRNTQNNISSLGKRKLADAFGEKIYNEQERYGQEITADFFKTNIGHGCI